MKLEINFQKLKNVVDITSRIAGKHPTLPVLSCILIDIKKSSAVFKATNLDIGIEVEVPIKADTAAVVAVPAHILSSFVSQVYDQNQVVHMEIESNNLHITSLKSKGVIKTIPSDDFPTIPKIQGDQKFTLPVEPFIKGLKSVWYSASISSVKPELSSVYIYRESDNLVFAATDSFRLAEKKVKVPLSAKLNDILIPFKNIGDIIRLCENIKGDMLVQSTKNLISFETDGIYITSRVIDGVFPDYRQIIPKGYATEAIVLKQDFLNSLKISNIFSDKFNHIHLMVDPKSKIFEIYTKNSDIGENKTLVDAALTGEKMEVNFNYKYIADCLQSIESDSLSLQLSGLNRPMVIRPVSGDQTFMYLVMPMNR